MCICVCVILQLHHTETMLRCGLPSEKEDGRKVSSDFVWLFFGEHAATVQYGCMWYYNYAMYILQCVIILKKKTTACGFSFNEGGCCWIQKNGERRRRLRRWSAANKSRNIAATYVNHKRGQRSRIRRPHWPPTASFLPLFSCTSAYITVLYLWWTVCVSGYKLHMQSVLLRHKEEQQDFILLCSKENRTVNECMHECELIIRVRIYTPCAAVLLYTPQLFPGSVVYRKKKRSMTFICFRYVSSCNTRRYLHNT